MGVFLWHQWAQYVAVFAAVYTTWAGIWGIFFRKFFWDFVGGTLIPNPNIADPKTKLKCDVDLKCGMMPPKSAAPFVMLIVNIPLIQIASIIFSLFYLALVLLPQLQSTSIYRSFAFRMTIQLTIAFLAILFYQGTNGAIYATVAAFGYAMAIGKGELMEEAKDNRGRQGSV
jgi:hypothetical protein